MRHRARRPFPTRALVVLGLTMGAGAGVYTTAASIHGDGPRGVDAHSAGKPAAPLDTPPAVGASTGMGSMSSTRGHHPIRSASARSRSTAPSRSPSRQVRPSQAGSPSAGLPSDTPGTGTSLRPSVSPASPDHLAPETSVSSDGATGRSAVLGFGANEPATFECSLDGSGFAPCTSPQGYSNLKPGWHSFAVRATDLDGNQDPSPAHVEWKATGRPPQDGQ